MCACVCACVCVLLFAIHRYVAKGEPNMPA